VLWMNNNNKMPLTPPNSLPVSNCISINVLCHDNTSLQQRLQSPGRVRILRSPLTDLRTYRGENMLAPMPQSINHWRTEVVRAQLFNEYYNQHFGQRKTKSTKRASYPLIPDVNRLV
jgi:hypothetical protein